MNIRIYYNLWLNIIVSWYYIVPSPKLPLWYSKAPVQPIRKSFCFYYRSSSGKGGFSRESLERHKPQANLPIFPSLTWHRWQLPESNIVRRKKGRKGQAKLSPRQQLQENKQIFNFILHWGHEKERGVGRTLYWIWTYISVFLYFRAWTNIKTIISLRRGEFGSWTWE